MDFWKNQNRLHGAWAPNRSSGISAHYITTGLRGYWLIIFFCFLCSYNYYSRRSPVVCEGDKTLHRHLSRRPPRGRRRGPSLAPPSFPSFPSLPPPLLSSAVGRSPRGAGGGGTSLTRAWCGGDDVNHRPVGNPKRKVWWAQQQVFPSIMKPRYVNPVGKSQTLQRWCLLA
jgi:hypothetical protein